jgi:hypothetical protein
MTKARDLANASTALSAVSATELGYLDGVTSAVQTQIDGKQAVVSGVNSTEIGYLDGVTSAIQTQLDSKANTTSATLTAPVLVSPEEKMTVSATAATGTINFDADTQGVLYYTSNASADWTLNVRGSSSTTINSKLAIGDSTTVAFLVTNGSTAYKHSALTIDGSAQTVKWSGGTAPAAGNASSIDAYSFTIIKTASATYTVLGAGPIKYA